MGGFFIYILVVFLRETYIIEVIKLILVYEMKSWGVYDGKKNKTLSGGFF